MKPGLALTALAAALGTLVTNPAVAQDAPPPAAASTQEGMHHAAVVIDTADGVVRKMCLAFPEAELSGIEALRRVDTRPNRFETFSGKGSGVCMLCGVGCASGACFCDPENFWAYHRAGPGETRYRTSSLGASSTVVRDGDVEAWKWGAGAAPAKTSVSEVCGVAEPPARTAGGPTTTAPAPSETTTTTGAGGAAPTTAASTPTAPATTGSVATRPAAGMPTTQPPGTSVPPPGEVADAPSDAGSLRVGDAPGSGVESPSAPDERAAVDDPVGRGPGDSRQVAGLVGFAALLGALLTWRSRLRRANRRGMRPVR